MATEDYILNPVIDKLLDVATVSSLLAFVAGALPSLSLMLTVVWTAIRVLETKTIQNAIKRRRRLRRIKHNERKRTGQPTGR